MYTCMTFGNLPQSVYNLHMVIDLKIKLVLACFTLSIHLIHFLKYSIKTKESYKCTFRMSAIYLPLGSHLCVIAKSK